MSHHDPPPTPLSIGSGLWLLPLNKLGRPICYLLIRLLLLNSPVSSIIGFHNAMMALGVKGQPNKVSQNSARLCPPHSIHVHALVCTHTRKYTLKLHRWCDTDTMSHQRCSSAVVFTRGSSTAGPTSVQLIITETREH